MGIENLVLMDRERIQRSMKRMVHEIAERNTLNNAILLFGIDDRGYAISNALADKLSPMFDQQVKSVQLPLKNADIADPFKSISVDDAEKKFIISVDDVIFSGQTMFTALKKISELLDPSEIHTAVMIDRGHRKFPIKAEFCGMELPTKLNEHVSVIVNESKIEKVVLSSSAE